MKLEAINLGKREYLLLGTAHVSKKSVEDVRSAIKKEKPDVVAVELCEKRYDTLKNKDRWKNTEVSKIIKDGKAYLFLANLMLSNFQRRIGDKLGVEPGAEMLAAVDSAKKVGARVEFVDRDIQITLKRAMREMGFLEKVKLLGSLMFETFAADVDEDLVEQLKDADIVDEALETLGKASPSVKRVLVDERDTYIAGKVSEIKEEKTVIVVGAGHLKGIKKKIGQSVDFKGLENVPKKISKLRVVSFLVPALFALLIGYGIFAKGLLTGAEMFVWWFLLNGIFSAIGVAVAFGHPLSILSAFLAAPFTSLNPAVAAGWVAGYVEAKVRKPKVKDFEALNRMEGMKAWWKNRVTRVLLVVVFANLGSTIGTVIALPYLLSLL